MTSSMRSRSTREEAEKSARCHELGRSRRAGSSSQPSAVQRVPAPLSWRRIPHVYRARAACQACRVGATEADGHSSEKGHNGLRGWYGEWPGAESNCRHADFQFFPLCPPSRGIGQHQTLDVTTSALRPPLSAAVVFVDAAVVWCCGGQSGDNAPSCHSWARASRSALSVVRLRGVVRRALLLPPL